MRHESVDVFSLKKKEPAMFVVIRQGGLDHFRIFYNLNSAPLDYWKVLW